MANIYNTEAKNLTFGDLSDAIDTLNKIAKDPDFAKMFRKVVKTSFTSEMTQLIRDIHKDSEVVVPVCKPQKADWNTKSEYYHG